MDLRDYLRVLRTRWWIVAVSVFAALAVSTLVTLQMPARYATAVTFFVTTPNRGVTDAYQGGLFSEQRVKSYVDLLGSDRLARAVIADQGLDLSPAQISERIHAQAVPDTVLLRVTVEDESRARSAQIAHGLATQFVRLVQSLETPPGSRNPSVKVEVVSGPDPAADPVSPRPVRNLGLAGVLGLLVGFGLALLREVLDTTVKDREDLHRLGAEPLLGAIPFDGTAKSAPLIVAGAARSPRAEAFRQLRTNLMFADVDHPIRTLVVTSSAPEEGKSTTAVNLAIALAEAGKRVVLVEADLRRPRVARYLDLEGGLGLTDVLAGQASIWEVLQDWGASGLSVLPSGSSAPNPSELLGSANMVKLLDELRAGFDTVLIDTPPLLPVTDAAVAAVHADGALLVARHRRTTRAQLTRAVDALNSVDARVLGCVFNMVRPTGTDPGGYEYAYYADAAETDYSHQPERDIRENVVTPASHRARPHSEEPVRTPR